MKYNQYGHSVCECGYTSCGGGRGCGFCSDCCGEHCECGLEDYLARRRAEQENITEDDFPPGIKFVN